MVYSLAVNIEVVYALADEQQLIQLTVEPGTGAREALILVLAQNLVTLTDTDARRTPNVMALGVYGLIVADDYVMQEGDRLEIYRPLLQDPMERRRQVARQAE